MDLSLKVSKFSFLLAVILASCSKPEITVAQEPREQIEVTTPIFTVLYSETKDYYRNVWDKGHISPAATFSDSRENLKQTFSYLNCALQNQYLNRGEWRLLEQEERVWDDAEELEVTVDIKFSDSILPTGATIPSRFIKHIKFTNSNVYKCYDFPNERPTKDWEEYQVQHTH